MTSREEFEAWYLKRFGQCDMQSAWAMERWEAWQACRDSLAVQPSDMPTHAGHAVPQWLRDQFSAIEDNAMRMGGCAVFTQMRTKVQAYFEMLRADLSYFVVLAERTELKAENESLRKDAERYRWLRDGKTRPGCLSSDPDKARWIDEYLMCGERLDAAIDKEQQP